MSARYKITRKDIDEPEGRRMERTQIMLDPIQRKELDQIAREENISRSNLLRRMIQECLQDRKRKRIEAAVSELMGDYQADPELTALNALDSEDFNA
jgi:metal-responsive CopG/Arc/MetJ family transcriptional regulator